MKTILISPFASRMSDGRPNAKDYPFWKELVALLKSRGNRVVQVGCKGEQKLDADDCFFDLTEDELVNQINKSDCWISVDSYFQHVAQQTGKNGIVLWGPSDPNIFGYPNNINLLKDRKYLRNDQYAPWHDEKLNEDAWVNPESILDSISVNEASIGVSSWSGPQGKRGVPGRNDPMGSIVPNLEYKATSKLVSIIIPTYNHLQDCLIPCIESIAQNTTLDSNIELVIVCNGCKDGTHEYVESLGKRFPGVVTPVFDNEPIGYTKATNRGIVASSGEFIILLNNDAVIQSYWPKDKWIQELIEPLDNPEIGITGPLIIPERHVKRDFVIFFCAAIKRTTFEKLGLLDEIFSPGGGEDADFAFRVQDAGMKLIMVPQSDPMKWNEKLRLHSGGFPIYHKGEATVFGLNDWLGICARNANVLIDRYAKDPVIRKLWKDWAPGKQIKINLGCGPCTLPDYINVDVEGDVDFNWDARKLPIPDETADEILASHLLEHFSPFEVEDILKEWRRALKEGGRLVLELPDMERICAQFGSLDTQKRYECMNAIYGALRPDWKWPHLYGWWFEAVESHLLAVGFVNIERREPQYQRPGYNMRIECIRPM